MIDRQAEIKKKGFSIPLSSSNLDEKYTSINFSKIKIGAKTLDDATLSLGELRRINPRLADKKEILRAMNMKDIEKMRDISNFFYRTSGIYSRLCRYMAYLYKYDWFVTPYINGCDGLIIENPEMGLNTNNIALK